MPKSANIDYWDEEVTEVFENFVGYLKDSQIEQLPPKKQRAMKLFKRLLHYYLKDKHLSYERRSLLKKNLELFSLPADLEFSVDYDHLGRILIRIFQPKVQQLRLKTRRRLITLNNLEKPMRKDPLSDEVLQDILDQVQWVKAIDRRVVACIIGVGEK